MTDWHELLVDSNEAVSDLVRALRNVAVLGIKTEGQSTQPAYYVPAYCVKAGLTIFPVPVYYPEATEILGQKVYRKLVDISEPVDVVDVFRRPSDIPAHVDDILAKRPRAVWMQSGIRHEGVAEQLARAGIAVVQDRCLMVELRKCGR